MDRWEETVDAIKRKYVGPDEEIDEAEKIVDTEIETPSSYQEDSYSSEREYEQTDSTSEEEREWKEDKDIFMERSVEKQQCGEDDTDGTPENEYEQTDGISEEESEWSQDDAEKNNDDISETNDKAICLEENQEGTHKKQANSEERSSTKQDTWRIHNMIVAPIEKSEAFQNRISGGIGLGMTAKSNDEKDNEADGIKRNIALVCKGKNEVAHKGYKLHEVVSDDLTDADTLIDTDEGSEDEGNMRCMKKERWTKKKKELSRKEKMDKLAAKMHKRRT